MAANEATGAPLHDTEARMSETEARRGFHDMPMACHADERAVQGWTAPDLDREEHVGRE